jgi:hypothetical protein
LALCLVCGKFDKLDLEHAMKKGWVFTRCPECHRGTPYDIARVYLSKTIGEENIEAFCVKHWFKDSGVCGYCRMKREEAQQRVA